MVIIHRKLAADLIMPVMMAIMITMIVMVVAMECWAMLFMKKKLIPDHCQKVAQVDC